MFPKELTKIIYEYTAISEKDVKINFASCMKDVRYHLWLEDLKLYSLCFFPDTIDNIDTLEVVFNFDFKKIYKYFKRDLSV